MLEVSVSGENPSSALRTHRDGRPAGLFDRIRKRVGIALDSLAAASRFVREWWNRAVSSLFATGTEVASVDPVDRAAGNAKGIPLLDARAPALATDPSPAPPNAPGGPQTTRSSEASSNGQEIEVHIQSPVPAKVASLDPVGRAAAAGNAKGIPLLDIRAPALATDPSPPPPDAPGGPQTARSSEASSNGQEIRIHVQSPVPAKVASLDPAGLAAAGSLGIPHFDIRASSIAADPSAPPLPAPEGSQPSRSRQTASNGQGLEIQSHRAEARGSEESDFEEITTPSEQDSAVESLHGTCAVTEKSPDRFSEGTCPTPDLLCESTQLDGDLEWVSFPESSSDDDFEHV